MAVAQDRTVYLPKDFLLAVVSTIPVWGIAGLAWGLAMAHLMAGSLLDWLFIGLLWGATVWFFVSIFLLIAGRELTTTLPPQEAATLAERLGEAVQPLRYAVEQLSPTSFVCTPKRRLYSFECNKLHVRLHDGGTELVGPAMVVNKVRKRLLAAAGRADRFAE
ncbi:MAG TPA: hypothetical protein VFE78_02025 [Gemmataceae bacterium]|nr:hypothetical protein [Gemmataceae bacterium]